LIWILRVAQNDILHILYIFLHKAIYVWLDIGCFKLFDAKPSKSVESFVFFYNGLGVTVVFHEKEVDVLLYDGTSLFVCSYEAVVDLGHKFYNLKILYGKTRLFVYFP